MSSALVRAGEIKLKGMNCPTLQSSYYKAILDAIKTHVCSLVYISQVISAEIVPSKTEEKISGIPAFV
jgi:hypothetical protein